MAKVVFVCWGNICRSPMAERVARAMAAELGIDVETDSVGISSEESGNPIDRRAAAVLRQSGYDPTGHRARRVTLADLAGTDLVVAAENFHISRLELLYPGGNYALLKRLQPGDAQGAGPPGPLVRPSLWLRRHPRRHRGGNAWHPRRRRGLRRAGCRNLFSLRSRKAGSGVLRGNATSYPCIGSSQRSSLVWAWSGRCGCGCRCGSGEDRSRPGGIFLWPGLPVLGAALGGEAEIPAAGDTPGL